MTVKIAYAGTDGGVFKSNDGGQSWVEAGQGRKSYILAVHPTDTERVYAGTSGSGVYWSSDGGASWLPMNSGLGDWMVKALVWDALACGRLYAGTEDGIWEHAIP